MGFGPRILGAAKYQQQVATRRGKAGFGPRVTGKGPGATPAAAPASTPKATSGDMATGLSIGQFTSALRENPAFLDSLYVQELDREDGPRPECLRAARVAAAARGSVDIVAEIDDVLKDIAPVGSTDPAAVPPPAHSFDEAQRRADMATKVEKIDKLTSLQAEAKKLGLDTKGLRSKKEVRDVILAKLREEA